MSIIMGALLSVEVFRMRPDTADPRFGPSEDFLTSHAPVAGMPQALS